MKKSTAAATAIAVLGSTIVSALPSPKAGGARQGAMIDLQGTKALKTDSVHGHRLLSKAKVVREGNHASHLRSTHRRAEGEANYYNWNNNNNNNNNYDNEYGLYNLPELYIQYSGCSSFMVPDQDGGEENQEQGQQQQNYNYNNDNNANNANNNNNNDNLYMSNLVLFTLCDSADCSSCSGEYAVDLLEFVDTYTEMKMEDQEYQCEYVREHCYCSYNNYNKNQNNNNQYNNNNNNNAANAYSYNDGGNDDGAGGRQLEYSNYYYNCLASCYAKAGLDSCMNQYYGGEEFQLQEYLECRRTYTLFSFSLQERYVELELDVKSVVLNIFSPCPISLPQRPLAMATITTTIIKTISILAPIVPTTCTCTWVPFTMRIAVTRPPPMTFKP